MELLDVINCFLGGLFILLGFLINANPNLIAGYNTMPKNEKENFDISAYKKLMKDTLIIAGLSMIVGDLVFMLLSLNIFKIFVSILPGCIVAFFLSYKSQNFYKKRTSISRGKYNRPLLLILGFVIPLVAVSLLMYGSREPVVSISPEKVDISGLYGFDILTKEIQSVETTDSLPKILLRTNGLGLGEIRKGYFKVEGHGICKLFLQADSPPYLKIIYSDTKLVYINFKEKNKTIEVYNELLKTKTSNR